MNVYKSDLEKIGNTQYPENGLLTIICDLETVNIEEILLREILKEYGDYKITSSEDFEWENGDLNIIVYTNLPVKLIDNVF